MITRSFSIARPMLATARTAYSSPSFVLAASRALHSSPVARDQPKSDKETPAEHESHSSRSLFGSILYGSESAQAEGDNHGKQHSKLVGRNKYVHEKITHSVIPSHREQYLEAADKYYRSLIEHHEELGNVKITGSWETIIGSVGNVTTILEYDGYRGYDQALHSLRTNPELRAAHDAMLPHLRNRHKQIVSEFSFWPSSPPHDSGNGPEGIFEMRSYELIPGKLLEWEYAWRKGLEARRRFVQPVGAFFAQIGDLHEVHHIWQYKNLEERKKMREAAWEISGWSETVRDTSLLTRKMATSIMTPTPWSPLR